MAAGPHTGERCDAMGVEAIRDRSRRVRWGVWAAGAVAGLAAAMAGADYLGWLGTRTVQSPAYLNVRFMALSEADGTPIRDMRVNCVRKGDRTACTQRFGQPPGIVSANFGLLKLETRSWLFSKATRYVGEDEVMVHVYFIHPNHQQRVLSYGLRELLAMADTVTEVRLEPRAWASDAPQP